MTSSYEINLKVDQIAGMARERGIDLNESDLRTIFLYEIGKLRMMSLRVFLIIHDFGYEKFSRDPKKYGFVKIKGEWFIPVYNIPQVLAGRVFENGRWGMPGKDTKKSDFVKGKREERLCTK
jgi:hypothetical protein